MRFTTDLRGMDQTIANLLLLFVSLSVISLALVVVSPVLSQYSAMNTIKQGETIMTSLRDEILKVQEEPPGSVRKIELEIKEGGIDLLNGPPRIIYYVEVPKEVVVDVTGMEFAYTARGAMFRINLSVPFAEPAFIGPGSSLVYLTKTDGGRINVTTEVYA